MRYRILDQAAISYVGRHAATLWRSRALCRPAWDVVGVVSKTESAACRNLARDAETRSDAKQMQILKRKAQFYTKVQHRFRKQFRSPSVPSALTVFSPVRSPYIPSALTEFLIFPMPVSVYPFRLNRFFQFRSPYIHSALTDFSCSGLRIFLPP